MTRTRCAKCLATIKWEQLRGIRVYRETAHGRVYQTRCDCGTVLRNQDGTPTTTEGRAEKDLR